MSLFAEISIPVSIKDSFSYIIPKNLKDEIGIGYRVMVPFNKKIYTGIVLDICNEKEVDFELKNILKVIDKKPIISSNQILFYKWLSTYYMSSIGEIIKSHLPSKLFLKTETIISLNSKVIIDDEILSDNEYLIYDALKSKNKIKIEEALIILDKNKCFPAIEGLINKKIAFLENDFQESYYPKMVKHLSIKKVFLDDKEKLDLFLKQLEKRSTKQMEAVMILLSRVADKRIYLIDFIKKYNISRAVIKSLENKSFLEIESLPVDRVIFDKEIKGIPTLNSEQNRCLLEINSGFEKNKCILLKGSSGSGKTEIYAHIINDCLNKGKSILMLIPEVILTNHIIVRLNKYFGNRILVYHSKYSTYERMEIWKKLNSEDSSYLIIGTKSAIFLPLNNVETIIIDEEQDISYKNFFGSFRYQARDSSIMLAKILNANILLGSSTPSIETFYNTIIEKKYALVELNNSYNKKAKQIISIIDIKECFKKQEIIGKYFSKSLLIEIEKSISNQNQVILLQNKRGYSSAIECQTCGYAIYCQNCDVTLTYYKEKNKLRCNYCNHTEKTPQICPYCSGNKIKDKGIGIEKIEQELIKIYPFYRIRRVDGETTRKKNSFQEIINSFQNKDIDILIGTQILAKGIDFENVSLVGIVNVENFLNTPSFRVNENCFQVIKQLSGRSGVNTDDNKLIIQTYNPDSNIFSFIKDDNGYYKLFNNELDSRKKFTYPPFCRIISINFSCISEAKLDYCVKWFKINLEKTEYAKLLGPSIPEVSKIRNEYIRVILVKYDIKKSSTIKKILSRMINKTLSISDFRTIKIIIDVDSY